MRSNWILHILIYILVLRKGSRKKSSSLKLVKHKNKKVNDKSLEWLNKKYGSIKSVKATRGKQHKYLGMGIDFNKKSCVKIEQFAKIDDMVDNGPVKLNKCDTAMTPCAVP